MTVSERLGKVSNRDPFWEEIDEALAACTAAASAPEVIAALKDRFEPEAGEAFFPGSGGETQLIEALYDSPHPWKFNVIEGDYHWEATDTAGNTLRYTEGDVDLVIASGAAG